MGDTPLPKTDDERYDYEHLRNRPVNIANSGNGNGHGVKLVWWLLGIFGTLGTTSAMFVGSALYTMNAQVAALTAKVDLLIAERAPRHRGESNGE